MSHCVRVSPIPPERARLSPHVATTNTTTTKHRRLSSAGRSRRRLSDARDAAARPFPTSLQTASTSLAALSLSSPTLSHPHMNGVQPSSIRTTSELEPDGTTLFRPTPPLPSKSGRRRGTIFTCESCSKVYRHPSCLIKHRWEHTPQWREASKFVLSKHQQVQLLEAAAILSHLSPSSASLPEDRSLWPSFLSGGLVPPPISVPNNDFTPISTLSASLPASDTWYPISSSVPSMSTIDAHCLPLVMNQKSVPMPVSAQTTEDALNLLALHSGTGSWAGSTRLSHSRAHSHSYLHSSSSLGSRERERRRSNAYEYGSEFGSGCTYTSNSNGGWSLPRSSVRSKSGSSRSRSQSVSVSVSESRSDDEHEDEDVDVRVRFEDEIGDGVDRVTIYGSRMQDDETGKDARQVEHGWDGMEMEMEMD